MEHTETELARIWTKSVQGLPLIPRNAPGASVSQRSQADLEVHSDRQDWALYQVIAQYSEKGRKFARSGDVAEALEWFARAENACASGRMKQRMLLDLAITHIRAAEAYLAMVCEDFDGAREKMLECVRLCDGHSEHALELRLFHFGANLIRIEALRGDIVEGIRLALDMLQSRIGRQQPAPPRIYFRVSQPLHAEVVLFQMAQLLNEVALLEVVAPPASMPTVAGFFLSSDAAAAMATLPDVFSAWFELKALLHAHLREKFLTRVAAFLEEDLADLLILRLLMIRDAATVAGDAALLRTVGTQIAACSMIPRLHRERLAQTDAVGHFAAQHATDTMTV